jgi:hypothetical protein
VNLTPQLQQVPRTRKCGSIRPLPYTPSWRSAKLVKHGDNFTFLLLSFISYGKISFGIGPVWYKSKDLERTKGEYRGSTVLGLWGQLFVALGMRLSQHGTSVKRFDFIHLLNLRNSVGFLGRMISPSQGCYLTQIRNKHRQTSMPRVGFKPTITAFEWALATVIGYFGMHYLILTYLRTELIPSWKAANCAAIQKIPSNFKEPEGSSPCSQEPSTRPYPEPVRSSPYHIILSL